MNADHACAAVAEELACVARGKLSRSPACILRGFRYEPGHDGARSIIRATKRDLFRQGRDRTRLVEQPSV